MSKSSMNIIIGIGVLSILFSIYGIISGRELSDTLFGIVIGVSLIGTALIENNKSKK
jgi:multisubunit Na+/H+ antiporter MnhF subunit